ncbi:unnamed protein product [Acanthoscelides obtectus]|uniref:Ras-GEF domain-containing protein n=1 Tax=Acanthoscelides obtectus TaxID=200917 RepID=A0A9P0KFE7_ACAOB|nr:unnamed protein product [Acanthoscelides obtectus]
MATELQFYQITNLWVPRYIITLHELLAHTPHDHVERKSLQNARQQLEDLSRMMHDEVSETENLRKNLAVERMIIEGCDILLDVNQVFVRQGTLIQLPTDKHKAPKTKIPSFKTEKEAVRQCFLFSNHLIIATRTSTGKLHLVPDVGKIPLADALLIEDPTEAIEDDLASSQSIAASSEPTTPINYQNRDFKMVVETKTMIPQQFNDMMRPPMANSSSISLPQSLKNDPKLFKDEADIRFSRTLNSCKVFYSVDQEPGESTSTEGHKEEHLLIQPQDEKRRSSTTPRRTSAASSVSGYGSETDRDRSHSYDSQGHRQWKSTLQKYEEEVQETQATASCSTSRAKMGDTLAPPGPSKSVSIRVDTPSDDTHLTIPKVTQSSSSETLTGTEATVLSAPCSPSNLSSVTLVGSAGSDTNGQGTSSPRQSPTKTPTDDGKGKERKDKKEKRDRKDKSLSPTKEPVEKLKKGLSIESEDPGEEHPPSIASHRASCSSSRSASISTTSGVLQSYYSTRRSVQDGESSTARSSFQHESPQKPSKAGVVITSFRLSKRSNPRDVSPAQEQEDAERARHKESVVSSACTMRVLNVLRHWISKHPQDFENDPKLKNMTIQFLDDIVFSPNLLPAEHKAAAQLLKMLTREEPEGSRIDVFKLVAPSTAEKEKRAPHIILMTKRFNDISRLVVSEILTRKTLAARVAAIEKWAAVGDICRCLHNFNGVLQICSAFTNTSVFRLKKTWEKVSKTTKHTIEKLQSIVTSDGRFRALRDALHRCDPPCIPYLGVYLTDLSFIEEDCTCNPRNKALPADALQNRIDTEGGQLPPCNSVAHSGRGTLHSFAGTGTENFKTCFTIVNYNSQINQLGQMYSYVDDNR